LAVDFTMKFLILIPILIMANLPYFSVEASAHELSFVSNLAIPQLGGTNFISASETPSNSTIREIQTVQKYQLKSPVNEESSASQNSILVISTKKEFIAKSPVISVLETVQKSTEKPLEIEKNTTGKETDFLNKNDDFLPSGILSLEQKIVNSCAKFGCNSAKMIKVMRCESEGRNVVGTWGHIGIFQFTNRTFYSFASKYGVQNANIWNTDHQIEVTSQMFAQGLGKQHWSCF